VNLKSEQKNRIRFVTNPRQRFVERC